MKTKSQKIIMDGHVLMDDILPEIENDLGVKLMARNPDDELNGYVNLCHTIDKNKNDISIVEIFLYEEDEEPGVGNSSAEAILNNATEGLSKAKKIEVQNKMIPFLGGHTTRFKKADNNEKKIEKFISWSKLKKTTTIKG